MRIGVQFDSDAFPAQTGEDGVFGKRLAEFFVAQLPRHGFAVKDYYPEDWGWEIALDNPGFPLYLGCRGEEGVGFLCYISPDKPVIRRGLLRKKVDTRATVERLADAVDSILRHDARIRNIVWVEEI